MTNKPEKLDLNSMDISAKNRAKLKSLFPSVFTETVNDKGELVEAIDFEKLKSELGTFSDLFESRRERFGLDWPGKKNCMKLIQEPSRATLKPARDESVNFDGTGNLFIEGDNLEVLKLLQKSYYGKVKMIYIDPPYNTGKEFIYPDKYSESLETYLEYAGLVDGEGRKFSTNTPNEGRFHTKWLNMMYPRLYLARNLLREDGVIFISIDDNEAANLRKLCDEIFGEENFVEKLVWLNKEGGGGSDSKYFRRKHEYLLTYARSKEQLAINGVEISNLNRYTMKDEHYSIRGPYYLQKLAQSSIQYSESLDYPIEAPDGSLIFPGETNGKKNCNRWSKSKVEWGIREGFIEFRKDRNGQWQVYTKQYLKCDNEGNPIDRTNRPLAVIENFSTTQASKYLKQLFNAEIFKYSKPYQLVSFLFQVSCTKDDIILDFFAGSCTTAHAVLDLNKEDLSASGDGQAGGGNRKFIMVQLPEPCDEKSEAFKAGYRTIADIGKERIRRVIKKIEEERAAKVQEADNALPGMAEEMPELDLGFKVFKLDKSNFKPWEKLDADASQEEIGRQLELYIEHIDPNSSKEDILYEILLKAGFMPTEKIEKLELAGKTVFSIADGALLICLEDEITRELIDAVCDAEPMQFICLDSAFQGNDQLKANAVQTFAARNQGRDKAERIVFRTV